MIQSRPLQELIQRMRTLRELRTEKLIYVTIARALVYGDESSGSPSYCSPQIRAINTAARTVENLLIGIRYKGRDNKDVGSTITRFSWVKVSTEETHYFYDSVNSSYCQGLTGEMEVIHCVYDNGRDCTNDVRAVNYGTVPLKMLEKNKEGK